MNRSMLVGLSVLLTSAFWLAVGGLWAMRQSPADPAASETAENAAAPVRPLARTSGVPVIPDGAPASGSVDAHLLIPVAGARAEDLVDSFARTQGIDIPAPQGMAVIAAAPGIVENISTSDKGGRSIHVRSPDRTRVYRYAGLGAYAPGLSEGQVLGAGEQLGVVGADANGGTPRLNFAVLAIMPDRDWSGDKRPLNPYPLLGGRRNQSR